MWLYTTKCFPPRQWFPASKDSSDSCLTFELPVQTILRWIQTAKIKEDTTNLADTKASKRDIKDMLKNRDWLYMQ